MSVTLGNQQRQGLSIGMFMQLKKEQNLTLCRKFVFAIISLSLAVFIIYSNSLTVEWHYDDHFNILDNLNIRLTDISLSNLQKTFYIDGRFLRPIAYLSFAINYYFGQYQVWGYHLVNLLIHIITSLVLFTLIFQTLHLPTIKDEYQDRAYSIALLSAFLWAVHPIQVHGVTTIVQRMASMAGMFYAMSMLLYLQGRLSNDRGKAALYYLTAMLAGILSLGTKENAIMLPIALLFYDFLLIKGLRKVKNLCQILFFCLVAGVVFIVVSLFYYDFSAIMQSYIGRPYTLSERLLTEPRIIVFYISLLLYPLSSRMTLLHDPAISHGLFNPWTTLPAIIFIALSLILAFRFAAKKPLLSFCVIFFFLNHVVEGSFIALELIYEHRNYIPSMFVFIPISIGILNIIRYYSYNHALKYVFVFSFSFLLAMLAHTVYYRNHIINTEIGLWLDNVEKSPRLSRVHNNIGQYFWSKGLIEKACVSFSTAYALNREMNRTQYGVIACNLGNCFFNLARDFDKAKALYEKALALYPGDPSSYSGLGLVYLKKGNIANAKKYLLAAMKAEPEHPEYLHNLSLMNFLEKDYNQSIDLAKQALSFNKNDIPSLMLLAQSFNAKGDRQQSIKYWINVDFLLPNGLSAKLALIELYTTVRDKRMLDIYLKLLKDVSKQKSATDVFDAAEKENPIFPIYIPNRILLEKTLTKEFSGH